MKIAIASDRKDLNSKVSEKGGRASYYLIFEGKQLIESIKNPFLSGGGAGWSIAYMLDEKGVKKIISGKIGDKMKAALEEKGLEFQEEHDKKISELI